MVSAMRRKLVLRVGVSLAVAFLVLELALRFLLFGSGDLGAPLRKAYSSTYGQPIKSACRGRSSSRRATGPRRSRRVVTR